VKPPNKNLINYDFMPCAGSLPIEKTLNDKCIFLYPGKRNTVMFHLSGKILLNVNYAACLREFMQSINWEYK